MNNHQVLITSVGLDSLKRELSDLVNVRRPQLVDRLSLARSMGDLSENSEYQSAKEELAFTDGRIAELEELVQNAKVTVPKSQHAVDVGHTVTVKVSNNEVAFQIVGEWEANPSLKKISHSSPLGKSLLGKRVGEKVEVDAPAGKILYTIMGIK